MRLTGHVLTAPRSFGEGSKHASVKVFDRDAEDVVELVAFGNKKGITDRGKELLALKMGEAVDLPVRVFARGDRVTVAAVD